MDFKGLEGLVSTMQQSKEVIVNDAAEKIKFLSYIVETNLAEGIKAGKGIAEFVGKGYAGALPHFNQNYLNTVFDFESLELTKASIALDFVLGAGYIATSNLFAENGLVSNLVGFDLSSSTRDFLIIYGCVDIAEGLVRTGHVAYFKTPIGTIKNEILGEVAKAITISQSYWGPKVMKVVNPIVNAIKPIKNDLIIEYLIAKESPAFVFAEKTLKKIAKKTAVEFDEVALSVGFYMNYLDHKEQELIKWFKTEFKDFKDFVSFGLKYNFGLIDDKIENVLEKIYKSDEDY